jgi:hypothetical protein
MVPTYLETIAAPESGLHPPGSHHDAPAVGAEMLVGAVGVLVMGKIVRGWIVRSDGKRIA